MNNQVKLIDLIILLLIVMVAMLLVYKYICIKTKHEMVDNLHDRPTIITNVMGGKDVKNKLMPIMDPEFNMREVTKQCILLEEHLNQKAKRCKDCQKKHMLTIEGLLEEAISLDKEQKMTKELQEMIYDWISIEKDYVNKKDTEEETAQRIRKFRKPLMWKYYENIKDYDI